MCVGPGTILPGGMATLEIPTYTETALHILYILYGCFLIHSVHSTYRTSVARDGKLEWTIDKKCMSCGKKFFFIYLDISNVFFN